MELVVYDFMKLRVVCACVCLYVAKLVEFFVLLMASGFPSNLRFPGSPQ